MKKLRKAVSSGFRYSASCPSPNDFDDDDVPVVRMGNGVCKRLPTDQDASFDRMRYGIQHAPAKKDDADGSDPELSRAPWTVAQPAQFESMLQFNEYLSALEARVCNGLAAIFGTKRCTHFGSLGRYTNKARRYVMSDDKVTFRFLNFPPDDNFMLSFNWLVVYRPGDKLLLKDVFVKDAADDAPSETNPQAAAATGATATTLEAAATPDTSSQARRRAPPPAYMQDDGTMNSLRAGADYQGTQPGNVDDMHRFAIVEPSATETYINQLGTFMSTASTQVPVPSASPGTDLAASTTSTTPVQASPPPVPSSRAITYGQVFYLQNLRTAQFLKEDGGNVGLTATASDDRGASLQLKPGKAIKYRQNLAQPGDRVVYGDVVYLSFTRNGFKTGRAVAASGGCITDPYWASACWAEGEYNEMRDGNCRGACAGSKKLDFQGNYALMILPEDGRLYDDESGHLEAEAADRALIRSYQDPVGTWFKDLGDLLAGFFKGLFMMFMCLMVGFVVVILIMGYGTVGRVLGQLKGVIVGKGTQTTRATVGYGNYPSVATIALQAEEPPPLHPADISAFNSFKHTSDTSLGNILRAQSTLRGFS